jgi:hypothetical protein
MLLPNECYSKIYKIYCIHLKKILIAVLIQETLEDTRGVIRSRKSNNKDGQNS